MNKFFQLLAFALAFSSVRAEIYVARYTEVICWSAVKQLSDKDLEASNVLEAVARLEYLETVNMGLSDPGFVIFAVGAEGLDWAYRVPSGSSPSNVLIKVDCVSQADFKVKVSMPTGANSFSGYQSSADLSLLRKYLRKKALPW